MKKTQQNLLISKTNLIEKQIDVINNDLTKYANILNFVEEQIKDQLKVKIIHAAENCLNDANFDANLVENYLIDEKYYPKLELMIYHYLTNELNLPDHIISINHYTNHRKDIVSSLNVEINLRGLLNNVTNSDPHKNCFYHNIKLKRYNNFNHKRDELVESYLNDLNDQLIESYSLGKSFKYEPSAPNYYSQYTSSLNNEATKKVKQIILDSDYKLEDYELLYDCTIKKIILS